MQVLPGPNIFALFFGWFVLRLPHFGEVAPIIYSMTIVGLGTPALVFFCRAAFDVAKAGVNAPSENSNVVGSRTEFEKSAEVSTSTFELQ